MNITFVGCGNVATVMAQLCEERGHSIQQIIARNKIAGEEFAERFKCDLVNFTEQLNKDTDLVIVTLSDNSLPEAIKHLQFGSVPVVHTAGSCDMNVLKTVSKNFGVLYPLQSLRKEMEIVPEIPFLIEGNNEETVQFIKTFARTLSNSVTIQDAEQRLRLHASAVIVNNFTNYLFSVAAKFCEDEKVDFKLLLPLIKQTSARVQEHSPLTMQTGPAVRGDITTLDKHLRLLTAYPKLRTLYMRLTDGIMNG
jgi:predicted short-subunit dehydrogenase-like oxidoreductase (DUF2520 family)